jgi:regulator of protease activity HflC (stomatin/prohibitin superfamily)
MKENKIGWIMFLAGLVSAVLLFAIYQLLGIAGLLLSLALAIGVLSLWFFRRARRILIGEMEVGVLFKKNGNFSRFINSGYQSINPFTERLESTITKNSQKASGVCPLIRTEEGIPVSVTWAVSYKIDVFTIEEGGRPGLARALPKHSAKMVEGKTVHALRHIIEQKSINDLYARGAIKNLEEEVSQAINERTRGLGLKEITSKDVQLGPIEMPRPVEKALEVAHERHVYLKHATKAANFLMYRESADRSAFKP